MSIYTNTTGQGEDVIILHGWGCHHEHMQPIAEHLSKQYKVTSVDLPGRGKSVWHSTIKTMHDIADQLLPYLPKQAIYIGWSFGGQVAMSIAARYPERVKKIIGVTTSPKFIEDQDWSGFPKPGFIAAFGDIEKVGFKQFLTQYYDNEFSHCQEKPKAYHDLLEILGHDVTDTDILIKGINIIDCSDLRKEFSAIQCPIELIFGGKDEGVNIKSIPEIKSLNSRANIHIVPDAQHMVFWTHQKGFNKVLDAVM